MTNGEYIKTLEDSAKTYIKGGVASVTRNYHMNQLTPIDEIQQKVLEAIVVDFINYTAAQRFMDLGLTTDNLKK